MAVKNTTGEEYKPLVMRTIEEDGTGRFTVTIDGEDHRFEVSLKGDTATIEYQETLSWRGQIRTKEPSEEVYHELVKSRDFQQYTQDVSEVRRA